MARKDAAKTQQEAAVDEMARDDEIARDTGTPALADDHDQIVEEAPGIGAAAEMSAPMGDPGDLSAFGRPTMLPDDLGIGDDSGLGGPVDPGADLGSTLLDDLAGDLSNPTDGFDGMSDGSGSPVLDDQSGWDRAGVGEEWAWWEPLDATAPTSSASEYFDTHTRLVGKAADAYAAGDDKLGDSYMTSAAHAFEAGVETTVEESGNEGVHSYVVEIEPTVITPGDDDDDDDDEEHESQYGDGEGSNDPPGSQTMPAPDDGTGGGGELIGGRGDIDPAPEAEAAGGAGGLIGGRGDVDPAPETEEQGAGELIGGRGDIDPLDGESTLLGGDTGDLAEMAAEADLGDVEVEVDDSLVDADIGEDV